jgi:hypothetical protein
MAAHYTVKVYRSSHLEPDTDVDGYEPIVLRGMPEDAVRVVAEVVEVRARMGPVF